jgi:hypothetical protein
MNTSTPLPHFRRPRSKPWSALCLWLAALLAAAARTAEPPPTVWPNGLPTSPDFFPIAVWLQPPARAKAYRAAGINLYVGLWRGPTEAQLAALREAGMKVICEQNDVGLAHRDDPTIVGWMHGDEPDNAQPLGEGRGYGPPIAPARIVADYERLRQRDPTRPVLLNLGQGVAWDDWHGRGVRSRHPEDYPEYVQGADIVSFDIYPVTHDRPAVSSNLWFVARGVERLVRWTGGAKPVWCCIECTRISHPTAKPTPHQVRAEVWMALIHGARGLIYFVHEWKPRFNESALLDDPEMLAAVTRLNRQIHELAPVLNSPTLPDAVHVRADDAAAPVAAMAKRHAGALYVFAVAMRDRPARARFELPGQRGAARVEVLGEDRVLPARDGAFEDAFAGYAVHLYRVAAP